MRHLLTFAMQRSAFVRMKREELLTRSTGSGRCWHVGPVVQEAFMPNVVALKIIQECPLFIKSKRNKIVEKRSKLTNKEYV
jgi:hypothetical protein